MRFKMKKMESMLVRIPAELKGWLKQKAKENTRSMTGELIELMKKAKEKEEAEKA